MKVSLQSTNDRMDRLESAIMALVDASSGKRPAAGKRPSGKRPPVVNDSDDDDDDSDSDDDDDSDDDETTQRPASSRLSRAQSRLRQEDIADDVDAKPLAAGTFTLRRKSGGGGGEYVSGSTPGADGLRGLPILDTTKRKVRVPTKDKKGNPTTAIKTVHLDDNTRNVVGPILADTLRHVDDVDDSGNVDAAKRCIRVAVLDDDGNPLPKTVSQFLFCTSAAGSFMLSGKLSIPVDVADDSGKRGKTESGLVEFSADVYAIGRHFHRDSDSSK